MRFDESIGRDGSRASLPRPASPSGFAGQAPLLRYEGAGLAAPSVAAKQRSLVPLAGIEPALLAELDFESSASTSSATGASGHEPQGTSQGPVARSRRNIAGGPFRSTRVDVILPRLDRKSPARYHAQARGDECDTCHGHSVTAGHRLQSSTSAAKPERTTEVPCCLGIIVPREMGH